MSSTYEQLTPIFRDVFDDDTLVPTPEMTAADVPAWDSVSHIRLIVAIEEHFGFRFETLEITDLKNVGELVGVIERKLKKG